MDNPASLDDLTAVGVVLGDGVGQVADHVAQRRLDQAWRALQREPGLAGLAGWVQSGQLEPEDVADVVAAAALRILRNPEGRTAERSAIDDYSEQVDHADATQDLYFTAAEVRRLSSSVVVPTAGSFKYS